MQHAEIIKIPFMSKKGDFIHIRSDEELHAALEESAARSDRKMTDQARYILRMALGLSDEGMERDRLKTNTKKLSAVEEKSPRKGGHSR